MMAHPVQGKRCILFDADGTLKSTDKRKQIMDASPAKTVSIDLAGLNALHEDALRYRRLRSMAVCRALESDGTGSWSIPADLLVYRARTFDEAVDKAFGAAPEA